MHPLIILEDVLRRWDGSREPEKLNMAKISLYWATDRSLPTGLSFSSSFLEGKSTQNPGAKGHHFQRRCWPPGCSSGCCGKNGESWIGPMLGVAAHHCDIPERNRNWSPTGEVDLGMRGTAFLWKA